MSYATGRLLVGSCLERLKDVETGSVDSIVTDPPYELGFMGKAWDASGVAYQVELWRECLRVLKPGGHLLAFGGTRTYHRMAVAIEDAGFEIRDSIHWVYGSGFPKSLDVSKAIDKAAGIWRGRAGNATTANNAMSGPNYERTSKGEPATPAAQAWQGWGTALKPAHEPIVLARKPLDGTVAANVLEHGTGALNIDGCRIGSDNTTRNNTAEMGYHGGNLPDAYATGSASGRWPANIIFDEAAGAELEDASRFFYCPKPGKKERDAGLDKLPSSARPTMGSGIGGQPDQQRPNNKNTHPTVKPVELMRYLVRLITPPGGVVLDPFLGSGTTAVAAILEGFDWLGCEMTEDYLPIIKGRVQWAQRQPRQLPHG